MDTTDVRLLSALQADARASYAELAAAVGLSPTGVARRLQRLEARGLVRGYSAELDWKRLGFAVTAFVSVTLAKQAEDLIAAFEGAVVQFPEVTEVHLMAGGTDYLLRVVVPDLEAYENFLKRRLTRVRGIANVQSAFALSTLKAGRPALAPTGQRRAAARATAKAVR